MTVGELIKHLQQFDADLEVRAFTSADEWGEWDPITSEGIHVMWQRYKRNGTPVTFWDDHRGGVYLERADATGERRTKNPFMVKPFLSL